MNDDLIAKLRNYAAECGLDGSKRRQVILCLDAASELERIRKEVGAAIDELMADKFEAAMRRLCTLAGRTPVGLSDLRAASIGEVLAVASSAPPKGEAASERFFAKHRRDFDESKIGDTTKGNANG